MTWNQYCGCETVISIPAICNIDRCFINRLLYMLARYTDIIDSTDDFVNGFMHTCFDESIPIAASSIQRPGSAKGGSAKADVLRRLASETGPFMPEDLHRGLKHLFWILAPSLVFFWDAREATSLYKKFDENLVAARSQLSSSIRLQPSQSTDQNAANPLEDDILALEQRLQLAKKKY